MSKDITQFLEQKDDYIWELPKNFRKDMRVKAQVFADEGILNAIKDDNSLQQLVNIATLPGAKDKVLAMPDVHQGYGFPIGGVAATAYPKGAISPGGIGYDINCGVRLLTSRLNYEDVKFQMEALSHELYNNVPSGVGKSGPLKLSQNQMHQVLKTGAEWAVHEGMGTESDLEFTESNGTFPGADVSKVPEKAQKRGRDQLGTIGGGNHFAEVDYIDEIYHEEAAEAYGIEEGQIVVLIHTGSRGLGHQTATAYIKLFMKAMNKYDFKLPDRGLACVPLSSKEGKSYYRAMAGAANYAWANRQVVTWEMRKAFANLFGKNNPDAQLNVLYDVAHNIAKVEPYEVDGHERKLIVHRKGATRAYGPSKKEIPDRYQKVGQPVFIPGSMGTTNYILAGQDKSSELAFGSSCHGAGRRMSRTAAKKQVEAGQLVNELKKKGIYVQAGSKKGVTEEAPLAYKDVHSVVNIVDKLGLVNKVASFKPVAVIKG